MIRRVLVANRGEIALRIVRACRDMNIDMVAVHSEADADGLWATMATRRVCIGPARAGESYLSIPNIIEAALKTGCDAVHPGFGFLSENPDFARKVAENGLIFIGPGADVMARMGDKSAARAAMTEAGVPVVPGSEGVVDSLEAARAVADAVGYPVLVKASAGGGGKGMRRSDSPDDLEAAMAQASGEAKSAFGDGAVYIEKLIENPRHIEVQILADHHGNVVHLGERECSMQRLRQKLLEESPSKAVTPELREQLGDYAVRAAKACGYQGAGTVEFVLAQDGKPYFIEMNTRIQVEHPVTEMLTGIDLVREQIRIAGGRILDFAQADIALRGHAIECRICAEDPARGFAPSPGRVEFLHLPGGFGVRADSALYSGCEIGPHYDSMVAKIITHGDTRSEAIYRMRRALEELVVTGVKTNLSLQYMLLYRPEFLSGRYHTGFVEANLDALLAPLEKEMML